MVILVQARIDYLEALLENKEHTKIDNFILIRNEEIAPRFLLEFAIDKLIQDTTNAFWWSPRLVVVDRTIVGMIGFKNTPKSDYSVEIGYGIVSSQQKRGFATEAVKLLLAEAFSVSRIQTVVASTHPSNKSSQRVLEKNGFIRGKSKIDLKDGEMWVWKKTRL